MPPPSDWETPQVLADLAKAVCGWHHQQGNGHRNPCIGAEQEARAIACFMSGRLRDPERVKC